MAKVNFVEFLDSLKKSFLKIFLYLKMIVSKHLTYFCYPIRLVLHQHLNSHVAYHGIPPEKGYVWIQMLMKH